MRREERRRKLHGAVLNTLYPPPPSPQPENEEKQWTESERGINLELINPDDFGESSSSTSKDNDEGDNEPRKLNRSQRKRLRKKKLKEDALRRGKLIGPLLPSADDHPGNLQNEPVGVRQNASEEDAITSYRPGDQDQEQEVHNSQKKLKNRRMAKKLAREKLKSSSTDNSGQGHHVECSGPESCNQDQKLNSTNPKSRNPEHNPSREGFNA